VRSINEVLFWGKGKGDGAHVENGSSQDEAQDAPAPPTSGLILQLLREAYPRLAKDLLRPLLAIMATARSICGGDAQKSEILMLIAMRSVEHPEFGKLSYDEVATGTAPAYRSLSTNIRSIADSAGMPRETVRRKVAELTAAGLVTRKGNALSLNPAASVVIGPLREALLRHAVHNYELIASLMKPAAGDRPEPPAAPSGV
jgi:DNA-binding transcriptional ArsR family regulator